MTKKQWEDARNRMILSWEKQFPCPEFPKTVGSFTFTPRPDGSGFDFVDNFLSYSDLVNMVKHLEELKKVSPRWKVVYNPLLCEENITNRNLNNFGNGVEYKQPFDGFTTFEDAKKYLKGMQKKFREFKEDFYLMPFEATEVYWQLEADYGSGWDKVYLKCGQENKFKTREDCEKYLRNNKTFHNLPDKKYRIVPVFI